MSLKANNILSAAIVAIGLSVAGFFIGQTFLKGKQFDRYVTVKGLSEREVPADLAVWPINIVLTGNDLQSLRQEIEAQNEAVYQFFTSQGFASSELIRGVVNISDARANIYNTNAQNSAFRYLAKSELTVRTADIPKLQRSLNASLELLDRKSVV